MNAKNCFCLSFEYSRSSSIARSLGIEREITRLRVSRVYDNHEIVAFNTPILTMNTMLINRRRAKLGMLPDPLIDQACQLYEGLCQLAAWCERHSGSHLLIKADDHQCLVRELNAKYLERGASILAALNLKSAEGPSI